MGEVAKTTTMADLVETVAWAEVVVRADTAEVLMMVELGEQVWEEEEMVEGVVAVAWCEIDGLIKSWKTSKIQLKKFLRSLLRLMSRRIKLMR